MPIVNKTKKKIFDAYIAGKDLRVVLLDSNHSNDQVNHEFLDDINANEVTATGYTANGQSLANVSVVVDDANNRAELDADDPVWNITGSLTARYYAVIDWTGNAATSSIVGEVDFGSNQTTTDGSFTIQWNAQGVIQLS